MLRVVVHKSAAAAHAYYAQGLKKEDYYSEGQEVVGKWHGMAAELLGLAGEVRQEAFAALVENRHPVTGERLTARTKKDRIVGYDLNFHAPKSLSLVHALTKDDNIVKAFREAVGETMAEIETKVATRVRKRGVEENRITGNFAWAEFVHFTSRPVGGIPDPHLHVHAFAMNATFDPVEERWKAANYRDIKADAPYSEAFFHSRLTAKLVELGYGIERTRLGWEIAGIPRTLIEKFSRRTAEIDRLAAKKGISDPKAKDALGASTREGKRKGLTRADLLAAWNARMTPEEKALIAKVRDTGAKTECITAKMALDEACEKLFAKNSVVKSKQVIAEALRFGVGSVTPEAAWREFKRREMVVREIKGQELCTSLDVLAEEVALINFVRSGRGIRAPINPGKLKFNDAKLSGEQQAAVRHILKGHDQVMVIRGAAGAGKTTTMCEVRAQIEAAGLEVFGFAPSATASRQTLREVGFENAETVAHLLHNRRLQERTRGQVIWIDEAGLLGVPDMWKIMQVVGHPTLLVLTGDVAQHTPVPRGDSLRILQEYAGLKIAELKEIRRQEQAEYRKAVASLAKGDLRTAFRRLDDLGAIVEVEDEAERHRVLADEFVELSRKGSVPLVVSPTRAESAKVTEAIREAKRAAGWLGDERPFPQYHNLQWEAPDKRRAENYEPGLIVQFHQNARGVRRGEMFRIKGRDDDGRVLAVNERGNEVPLALQNADRFQVYEEREIRLARGDRIRITRNGDSHDGRRLNNGNVFTVEKFSRDGKIVLNTGAVLDSKHGHFAMGYSFTSWSSQSKTMRDVLVAQSAESFLASSREQFYVSISRGKNSIRIFTDDRQGLQDAVGNSSLRRAGIELAGFSKKEVGSLMSEELGAKQWRDMVKSRTAEGEAKTHVRNLLKQRRMEGTDKPPTMDFRQYLDMRAKMAGPDGKSRSKGHPSGNEKTQGNVQNRGRSFIRPTELTTPTQEKMAAARAARAERAAPQPARQSRLAKGYQAARENFKSVVGRAKIAVASAIRGKRENTLPRNTPAKAAKHALKERARETRMKAKQQTKTQQKAPAPVIRRGR